MAFFDGEGAPGLGGGVGGFHVGALGEQLLVEEGLWVGLGGWMEVCLKVRL